jgi:ABC-2 type transport system ATP-binding protein
MTESIIAADGLTREFRVRDGRHRKTVKAVDGLTISVEPGESVGYIGANGAGKSTTIKMLTGILVPTSGTVRTCGLRPVPDRRKVARQVGVVFGQRSQLWWDLPVRESFRILAAIHNLTGNDERSRTSELVGQLELTEFLTTPVRQLSLGQRMRAEVAAALLHRPRLIILDEPTIGLDVLSKQRLREFLTRERREHGTTLLLTTHDMGDVERLCDRILVIDHGRLAYDGGLPGLSRTANVQRVLVVDLAMPAADLTDVPGAAHLGSEAGGLRQRLAFDAEQTTAAKVLAAVAEQAEVRDLTVEEPDIEDVVRRIYAAARPVAANLGETNSPGGRAVDGFSTADVPDLTGRTVIVTGASSGIGLEAAKVFRARGATVVFAVRDPAKGERAAQEMPGPAQAEVRRLELASLDSVRAFAKEWGDRPVDLLVNNAGVMVPPLGRTKDGFELQFGTNHLGHFALTNLLLPQITATGRVVTVSSGAHQAGRIDFDDLNWERKPYRPWRAYGQSKLANLLFTSELQRRLTGAGSTVLSMAAHPGYAATNLQSSSGSVVGAAVMRLGNRFVAQSAGAGALPTLLVATQDLPGDTYAGPRNGTRGVPAPCGRSKAAADEQTARRLWQVSESLTGTAFPLLC